MKKQFLLLLAATIVISSCRKEDSFAPTNASNGLESVAKTSNTRAVSGSMYYQADATNSLSCNCGSFFPVGTFSGSGNLTHLGSSTSKIKPCVAPLYSGSSQIGNHVGIECAYFQAANGDILYCTTRPYDLLFTATAAVGTAIVDFTGGTGRFAGATGSITGLVTVPYSGGTASFTNINGTITY